MMARSTNPFCYFDSSPEVIRLVVMMYVKYPLSPRNVEDLLYERGIDICHETVRLWWSWFGPMFNALRRRSANPRPPKPTSIRAQVAGSGTTPCMSRCVTPPLARAEFAPLAVYATDENPQFAGATLKSEHSGPPVKPARVLVCSKSFAYAKILGVGCVLGSVDRRRRAAVRLTENLQAS